MTCGILQVADARVVLAVVGGPTTASTTASASLTSQHLHRPLPHLSLLPAMSAPDYAPAPANAKKRAAPIGPVLGTVVPRFAGRSSFCRLPELHEVAATHDVAVAYLGVPFDGGCSFRPGARFGPSAIRQASRNLRTQFHPSYDAEPYHEVQAADAGDVSCNPFCIGDALTQARLRRAWAGA